MVSTKDTADFNLNNARPVALAMLGKINWNEIESLKGLKDSIVSHIIDRKNKPKTQPPSMEK